MSSRQCNYLDESHPALRSSNELRARAVALLVEEALACSVRFRLEFDQARLFATLGPAETSALLPTMPEGLSAGPIESHEEMLDEDRRRLLALALSFDLQRWPDLPLNYIRRVVLFDAENAVVLRANDNLEFVLFALPREAHERLLRRFDEAGLPRDVITEVEVDIEEGEG